MAQKQEQMVKYREDKEFPREIRIKAMRIWDDTQDNVPNTMIPLVLFNREDTKNAWTRIKKNTEDLVRML